MLLCFITVFLQQSHALQVKITKEAVIREPSATWKSQNHKKKKDTKNNYSSFQKTVKLQDGRQAVCVCNLRDGCSAKRR